MWKELVVFNGVWFELIYCNGLIYLIKDSLIYKEGFLYKGVFNGLYCVWVSLFNLFSFKLFFFSMDGGRGIIKVVVLISC